MSLFGVTLTGASFSSAHWSTSSCNSDSDGISWNIKVLWNLDFVYTFVSSLQVSEIQMLTDKIKGYAEQSHDMTATSQQGAVEQVYIKRKKNLIKIGWKKLGPFFN